MGLAHLPDRTGPKLVQTFLHRHLLLLELSSVTLVNEIISAAAILVLVLLWQLISLVDVVILLLLGHMVITCHLHLLLLLSFAVVV